MVSKYFERDPKLKLTQVCAVIRQVYGTLTVFDAMQHSTEEEHPDHGAVVVVVVLTSVYFRCYKPVHVGGNIYTAMRFNAVSSSTRVLTAGGAITATGPAEYL